MRTRTLAVAAAVAAATITLACKSTPKKAAQEPVRTVADADLGRLAPEDMGPVQAARGSLFEARDATARAQLRLQESRHEEAWANADRAAAESDRLRAAAEMAAAKEAGDQRRVAAAEELAGAAALRAQAADARIDYARKLVQAREAEVAAAEARARRAEWDLERAKLTALRQANVPAASKYDPAPIDKVLADAAKAEEAARARARDLGGTARAAYDHWRTLNDRYEARARPVPTG
jgi:hypothetical protein